MGAGARVYGGVVVWILAMLTVLSVVDIGDIRPIEHTMFFDRVASCAQPDCDDPVPLDLPFSTPARYTPGIEHQVLQFTVPLDEVPTQMQAFFIPKYNHHLQITVNGALVHAQLHQRHPWMAPLLVEVSPSLLQLGENGVMFDLSGQVPGQLDLQPFHFGDLEMLSTPYDTRFMLTQGLTQLALGLMILLTLGYFVVWLARTKERMFLWIALSCVSACVFLALLGTHATVGTYRISESLHSLSVASYVLFMLKFVRSFLGIAPLRSERVLPWVICGGILIAFLLPMRYVDAACSAVNLCAAVGGIVTVAVMWQHRRSVPKIDFLIFFPALSLALALAFDGLFLVLTHSQARSMNLLHLMPLLTALVCLWLILSQLIRSLTAHAELAATLHSTIAEKSVQLETSFNELATVRKNQTISQERSRILLELHDGVGGQLVNTLAYMESQSIDDPTLRTALEDALRDLALMMDSIESQDSLATLLGMMRTRLEGLLAKHGVSFEWQIQDEPLWPTENPSDNLHIARIVQEAITNVIKHARASTITVYADHRRVAVSDDGLGFDVGAAQSADRPRYGLTGMRRRASKIDANLSIQTGETGTTVSILRVET